MTYKLIHLVTVLTLAFAITGCSLEKDMAAPVEDDAPKVSDEQSDETKAQPTTKENRDGNEEQEENQVEDDSGTEAVTSTKIDEQKLKEPTSQVNQHNATKNVGQTSKQAADPQSLPSSKTNTQTKPTTSSDKKNEGKTEVAKPTTPPASVPPSNKEEHPKEEKSVDNTITYSIVISSTEVPLPATEMEIKEGDTVLQALISITKAKAIQMDYRGGQGATAYVEGIDNVYEFDRGQGSGWMYRVNGIFPDRGAGVVPLLPGDVVEWLYTTDLGKDLGADLKPFRR